MGTMRQFRVLLWKEWRGARALAVGLAIALVVLVLAAWAWEAREPGHRVMVGPALALFVLFAAAALGAVAIAGERRAGALTFQFERPISPWRLWGTKLALSLGLWVGFAVLAALLGALTSSRGEAKLDNPVGAAHYGLFVFCSCLLVSSALERVVLAVVLGSVIAFGLLVAVHFLYPFWAMIDGGSLGWQAAFTGIICGALLGLSAWTFRRVGAGGLSKRRTAGILGRAIGLALVVIAAPQAVCISYGYALPGLRGVERVPHLQCGRDGRRVALSVLTNPCPFPFAPSVVRCCILDCTSGEQQVLTRLNSSSALVRGWSPRGRYLAYWVSWDWAARLVPGLQASGYVGWPSGRTGVLDTATGRARLVPCAPSTLQMSAAILARWADEDLLVLQALSGQYLGYRPSTGELRPLGLPHAHEDYTEEHLVSRQGSGLLTFRRCPDAPADHALESGPLALYDPARGKWVERPLPSGTRVLDVSRDRRRIVFCEGPQPRLRPKDTVQIQVLDLTDRSATPSLVGEAAYGAVTAGLWVCRFSPTGRWVLSYDAQPETGTCAASLYEVETARRRELSGPPTRAFVVCQLSLDESALVWNCQAGATRRDDASAELLVYVQDITTGALHAIPKPRRDGARELRVSGPVSLAPGHGALFFAYGAAAYRIRLDGTGLEQVFPERKPIESGGAEPTEKKAKAQE